MKNQTKIIISLVSLFILSYTAIYSITELNKQQRVQIALDSHLDKLEIQYNTLIHHWKVTANAAYKSTIGMTKVMDIFNKLQTANENEKTILRKKLYKTMINKYIAMKTKGVSAYSFILPDQTAFLRMSNPQIFGDSVSSHYRVEYINKFKKPIYGYERGKITPSFRNAFPIFSKPSTTMEEKNDNYLGILIISFVSTGIEDYLSQVSKIDTHFLIRKDIFNKKEKEKKYFVNQYTQSNEHIDYLIATRSSEHSKESASAYINKNKQIKAKIYKDINKGKKFSLYTLNNSKATITSFYPIKNIKDKKTVAWIVSSENDTFIDMTLEGNLVIRVVSFFILLILVYFLYKILNQKEILDIQVKEKTNDLAKINRELEESEYELQLINENLEETIKKELDKNKHIQEQLFKSEKMASMGDMIGNIAHQWRQPLSIISTGATGMKMQKEFDTLSDEQFLDTCDLINDNAQYLSKTIDDFKNFIKGDREKAIFDLTENINSFLHLVEGSVKNHNLNIILDLKEDIKIDGYPNELTQCFINIFNNAKDVIKKQNYRYLFISTSIQNDKAIIKIKDNGGGIPRDVLPKIFEPYFTTKHKSQGTGLGLHMTYNLIVDGMGGTVEASNVSYDYDGKDYVGAEFEIILPI